MGLALRAATFAAVTAAVLAPACSSDDAVGDAPPPSVTVELDVQAAPSTGTLRMSGATYELAAACYTSDAGVRAVGVGLESGERVEVYVQTDADAPYLGIRLPDGALVEPALDETLDFYVQDDVIRASAIRLARDLDLETGRGTPMGFGEVEFRCSRYEDAAGPAG